MGEHGSVTLGGPSDNDTRGPVLESLIVLDGEVRRVQGADVFGDTMRLAFARALRDIYRTRTVILGTFSAGCGVAAAAYDNVLFGMAAAGLCAFAAHQGVKWSKHQQEYRSTLDEVVSHGWAPRAQLETIDARYIS